jgi:hypothetical protein
VFTKTTKTGSVVVTADNVATTYYVKGTAGSLNTIRVDAPTAALGTTAKVTVTGTDVFGNAVSGSSVALQVVSTTATTTYTANTDASGTVVRELTGLAVGKYDLLATATVATAVTGLTAPTGFVRSELKIVDLAALVATKDAELATATAKYDALVKRFNALAVKYNKKVVKKYHVKLVK